MPATMVRAVGPGWEERLLDALRAGPVTVARHRDPVPRLRRLGRYADLGSGNRIPDRARRLLLVTINQARDEGLTWDEIAGYLGITARWQVNQVRYLAGKRTGTAAARFYREL